MMNMYLQEVISKKDFWYRNYLRETITLSEIKLVMCPLKQQKNHPRPGNKTTVTTYNVINVEMPPMVST
jgi:hypothetical protein